MWVGVGSKIQICRGYNWSLKQTLAQRWCTLAHTFPFRHCFIHVEVWKGSWRDLLHFTRLIHAPGCVRRSWAYSRSLKFLMTTSHTVMQGPNYWNNTQKIQHFTSRPEIAETRKCKSFWRPYSWLSGSSLFCPKNQFLLMLIWIMRDYTGPSWGIMEKRPTEARYKTMIEAEAVRSRPKPQSWSCTCRSWSLLHEPEFGTSINALYCI